MKRNPLICALSFLTVLMPCSGARAQMTVGAFPYLGTLQRRDLDRAKYLELDKQLQRAFNNRNERLKDKAPRVAREKVKNTADQAKPWEYKTKGIYIEKIEVTESKILTAEEINNVIDYYEQTNITFNDLVEMLKQINELYLDKGIDTAWAYMPEQRIENHRLKIALIEGKIGKVTIEGNRWTEKSHIYSRLGLNEGDFFNMIKLENNILVYSRYNNGVTLKGDLVRGTKEGTSDVKIKVKEKAPYHATAVADNSGRDTIGKNRLGLLASHDSLLGYRDKLSSGVFATRYSWTPFIDYSVPINKYDDHIGVSFAYNKSEIGKGPLKDANVENSSQNYSIYYTHPFIHDLHDELNSTFSYTYKRAVNSVGGKKMLEDKIPELKAAFNYRHDTPNGVWFLTQNISYAAPWYQKRIDYFKFEGSVVRLHDFGHRFLGQLRGNYQYVPQDKVPYSDQMSAGGFGSVRGYSPPGMLTAKSGYQINAELYFPIAPEKFYINCKSYRTDDYVRPFVFTDYAALYPYKGAKEDGFHTSDVLLSTGAGLRIQLPYDIVLKATFGVPLRHNRFESHHGGDWGGRTQRFA